MVAEIGIAKIWVTPSFGARRIIPAVAPTDNAKPGSIAWNGSIKTNNATAAPSAAVGFIRAPWAFAINEIAAQAEPPVSDDDLDGFIQEIIRVVDKKAEEIKEELEGKTSAKPKKDAKPAKKSKK